MSMKKSLLVLSLLVLIIPAFAQKYTITPLPYKEDAKFSRVQNLSDQFDYALLKTDSKTNRTNKIFHYRKTNQDGKGSGEDVWIYYPDPYTSECFYVYDMTKDAFGYVKAEYGTDYQPKKITSYSIDKKFKLTESAVSEFDKNTIKLTVSKKKKDDVVNGIIPSYNLNFDFIDLNSMIPFLKNKEADFTFGVNNLYLPSKGVITKVSMGLSSRIEMYVGKTVCRYIGKTTYKNTECFTYEIIIEGYESLPGKLYVSASDYSVVEINTSHFGSPLYNSLKFTLIDQKTITPSQWEQFRNDKIKEYTK